MKEKIALLTILAPFSFSLFAQEGTLDPSFGTGGIVITDFEYASDVAYSMALQDDGKMVVVGFSNLGPALRKDITMVRYDADGVLDPSFGDGGKVITDIGGLEESDFAYDVAIQNDGKIVVTGTTIPDGGYKILVVRYNSDGSLDPTFGSGGYMETDFGGMEEIGQSVKILDDGKIIVGGFRNDGLKRNFALIKLNTDGTLDDSFGTGGKVYTSFAGDRHDSGYDVEIDNEGRIVLAGYSYVGTSSDFQFALARYMPDGSLDATFDGDGKLLTDAGLLVGQAYAMVLQPDNKIVVGGYGYYGFIADFAVVRYNQDGTLDPTFGVGGITHTDFGSNKDDWGFALCLQPDGKILLAGAAFDGSHNNVAIARYRVNGFLDPAFGGSGMVVTPIGPASEGAFSILMQPDDRILISGYTFQLGANDFLTARYNPVELEESTADTYAETYLQLSPNPCSDHLSIQSKYEGLATISDITGAIVWRREIDPGVTYLSTQSFAPGIYFLHLQGNEGVADLRFVKH
ncbi:MAG: T9SS type A sorting domain-containing protein [Chitinophagales bacterium]